MAVTWAWASTPSCWHASRRPDLRWWWAAGCPKCPSQGYELFNIPTPAQPLVHVHADADELGKLSPPHAGHPRHAAGVCCGAERSAPTAPVP